MAKISGTTLCGKNGLCGTASIGKWITGTSFSINAWKW
jgi:hypothetical protein